MGWDVDDANDDEAKRWGNAHTRGGTAAAEVSLVKACVSSLTWLPGAWVEKVAWMPTLVLLSAAACAEGGQEVEEVEAMSRVVVGVVCLWPRGWKAR